MENDAEGIKNFNTSVKKRGDDITFLRRIVPGCADGSYGVEVALLAGVPQSVVSRARVILNDLEEGKFTAAPKALRAKETSSGINEMQTSLFGGANDSVIEALRMLDLNTLTPIEALTKLYELKGKII